MAKAKAAKEKMLRITLVKSAIGYNKRQKVTAFTLGLRKLHKTVTLKDTPQIRGMVNQISHLVQVEEVEA